MQSGSTSTELIQQQVDKVLSSPGFARNERLSRFLRFVVEKQLEGKTGEIKESLVGIDVFGRTPGYDTRSDSVVRTEAAKLRARLAEYYAGEGASDPIVVELPKGGYTPVFHQKAEVREAATAGSKARAPHRATRRWVLATCAGAVIALAAAGLWRLEHQSEPIPIAVLPLVNLSQDPANEYFADGLTDEIIRNLSILEGLAVRSQTSSFAFKGKPRNVREAGRQLAADYILEGSVMRAGQRLRINVQLVRVRDDFPLWSDRFDRELADVFAIQDEISRGIVNGLRLKLGRGRRRYETSTEAYDLYLRARALGADRGVDAFEQAIAQDPSFAPAFAGLAAAYAYRSGLFSRNPNDEIPKMQAAAEKAMQLDPMLAEAHDALGMAYARDAKWEQSEKTFRRAIELDPNRSQTRLHFAMFLLWPLDRTPEALKELRLAEKTDPLSTRIRRFLVYILHSAGRYDEAAALCEKLPSIAPSYCGRVRFLQGRTAEAIRILESNFNGGVGITPGSEVRAFLGYAYAQTGRRHEAERMAADTNPFNQAVIFAGLGDKERALEAMERSTAAGPFRVGRQLTWPELALIRNHPRMKALRRKVGLPE